MRGLFKRIFTRSQAPASHRLGTADQAAGLVSQGNDFLARGLLDEAEVRYRQAIANYPDCFDAYNNLGYLLISRGQPLVAEPILSQAISLKPDSWEAHSNLGLIYKGQGHLGRARAHLERALEFAAQRPGIYWELGSVLYLLGETDGAIDMLRRGLALAPDCAEALKNVGMMLKLQGKPGEAAEYYRKALAYGEDSEGYFNLGTLYASFGKWDDALGCFEQASALDGNCHKAQGTRALILLLLGDYEGGFALYEAALDADKGEVSDPLATQFLRPKRAQNLRWDGTPLDGKRLWIWCEHGLGDAIMMLRYVPLLKAGGAEELQISCPPSLSRLVGQISADIKVLRLTRENPEPDAGTYDFHCSIISLPYLFRTRLDSIPNRVPYLKVPEDMERKWTDRLGRLSGPKIGLVWSGNPDLLADTERSIPLRNFSPVFQIDGVNFISLQKGRAAEQLKEVDFPILDWMDECEDMLDTAALVENLDLVISVDTSIAHLVGALGKPVWLLNRYTGDWRWLLDRSDSPWYPTMRIFRQPELRDWKSVIAQVAAELRVAAFPM